MPRIKRALDGVKAARFLLRPILSSKLSLNVKIATYKLYIRSRLTYAAPAWYGLLSQTNKTKLKNQQSTSLRWIVDAPRYVRKSTIQRDLKIESLDTFIRRLTTDMFARADKSGLSHLRGIAPLHARPPDGRPLARELITSTKQNAST